MPHKPASALTPAVLAACLAIALGACSQVPSAVPPSAAMHGDAARPAAAQWLRSELYFAIGEQLDGASPAPDAAAEARWQAFVDTQITPRFADGFSVYVAYGQWLDRSSGQIGRLPTRVLVVLHEDNADNKAKLDALRSAWKQLSGDESVLWVSTPAAVSF